MSGYLLRECITAVFNDKGEKSYQVAKERSNQTANFTLEWDINKNEDGDHPTYSRRLRTQMEEFRKFARWNSSLLYIIGFMIVLVSCSALAYFFLYNKESTGESLQTLSQQNPEKTDPTLKLVTLTFSDLTEDYCFANETEKMSLRLIAKNNTENWEEWVFGCKGSVVQLRLEGPFLSRNLQHFDNLFGSTVTKIVLFGSEICSTSQSLDTRIFKRIDYFSIFNSTERCDGLLSGFLEDIPQNLTIVEFNSVVVSQKLESYFRDLISSKQISQMQLKDLHYL